MRLVVLLAIVICQYDYAYAFSECSATTLASNGGVGNVAGECACAYNEVSQFDITSASANRIMGSCVSAVSTSSSAMTINPARGMGNIILWLDANNVKGVNNALPGSGKTLSTWTDLSGVNDSPTVLSPTAEFYIYTSSPPNSISRNTVQFFGNSSSCYSTSAYIANNVNYSNGFAIYIVLNHSSTGYYIPVLAKSGAFTLNSRILSSSYDVQFLWNGTTLCGNMDNELVAGSNFVVLTVMCYPQLTSGAVSGMACQVGINKSNICYGTSTTLLSAGNDNKPITIGCAGTSYFTGYISELIIMNTVPPNDVHNNLINYLINKWQL